MSSAQLTAIESLPHQETETYQVATRGLKRGCDETRAPRQLPSKRPLDCPLGLGQGGEFFSSTQRGQCRHQSVPSASTAVRRAADESRLSTRSSRAPGLSKLEDCSGVALIRKGGREACGRSQCLRGYECSQDVGCDVLKDVAVRPVSEPDGHAKSTSAAIALARAKGKWDCQVRS